MKIPYSYIDSLTRSLNMLSSAAKRVIKKQLETIEYTDLSDLRDQVLAMLKPLLDVATNYAAGYAATVYDLIRNDATGSPLGTTAYPGWNPDATEGAVRALVGKVESSSFSVFQNLLLERIDYEIKKAAANSTIHNAQLDPLKPRYARVPTGAETCPFCIMLASRGFKYHSRQSAGEFNHFHANCDCRIIQGYEGMEVDGYDPKQYYDQYVKDLRSGKLKLKDVTKETSHVITWNSDDFKSVGDFTSFIKKAKDIDDLQQRCAIVEQEFVKSGLSDRYYKNIGLSVREMKDRLIKSVA